MKKVEYNEKYAKDLAEGKYISPLKFLNFEETVGHKFLHAFIKGCLKEVRRLLKRRNNKMLKIRRQIFNQE